MRIETVEDRAASLPSLPPTRQITRSNNGNHQRKSLYFYTFSGSFLFLVLCIDFLIGKWYNIQDKRIKHSSRPKIGRRFKGWGNTVRIRSNSHCRELRLIDPAAFCFRQSKSIKDTVRILKAPDSAKLGIKLHFQKSECPLFCDRRNGAI